MRFILLCLAVTISGAAALAYELVWVRRLGEIFGQTAYAVNVVLGVFFAGMGVGAWLLGRVADRRGGPIGLFCVLELLIAACGIGFLTAADLVERLYLSLAPAEWPLSSALGLKALLCVVLLAVPTLAMGGTLPAITRHVVRRSAELGSRLGWLYGLNTLGAAGGVALVMFALLPRLGMRGTLLAAVGGNAAAAVIALAARLRPGGATGPAQLAEQTVNAYTQNRSKTRPTLRLRPRRRMLATHRLRRLLLAASPCRWPRRPSPGSFRSATKCSGRARWRRDS
jgi:spermidine synthase